MRIDMNSSEIAMAATLDIVQMQLQGAFNAHRQNLRERDRKYIFRILVYIDTVISSMTRE